MNNKPKNVEKVIYLWLIIGIIILCGIFFFIYDSYISDEKINPDPGENRNFFDDGFFAVYGLLLILIIIYSVILLALAIIPFCIYYFLIKEKKWAWTIGLIYSLVATFFSILFLLDSRSLSAGAVLNTILVIFLITLVYFHNKKDVKSFFWK